MPTRCASRPCLFLFFFFVFFVLGFFLGGGESGFEPREGGEPTESASRILVIGMPRSLRAAGVRASYFMSLGKCAPGDAAVCARVQNPPAPGPIGRSKRMACANEGARAFGHAAGCVSRAAHESLAFARRAQIFRELGAAMGARALKAAWAPIAPEIGRCVCGGLQRRWVGRAPRPDRRLLNPHSSLARVAAPLRR